MFISFDSSSGVRWFGMPLLLSLWVRATKKPGTGRRHGLEGSLVGWAIHHSHSSLVSTL
jgi:hypothetical protein